MVCYSHLSQNFPQFIVIHTVKGFGIVNEAEIDAEGQHKVKSTSQIQRTNWFSNPFAVAHNLEDTLDE